MLKRILFFFLLIASLQQQSFGQGACPGSFECEGAGVLCSVDALNGFVCNNPATPNTQFPFPNLCFGVGVPHNLNWWAFVGNGLPLTLTFNFDPASCEIPFGIQAGVFEASCDGSQVWDCNASCNTSTFSLSGPTQKCEIYYVWVDGCNGDVCTYTISVNGSGGPPSLQRPMPRLFVDGSPCAGGTVDVCFPGYADQCDPVFEWTVDGVPTGGPDDECVEVMIPCTDPLLPIQVCLTATIGNPLNPSSVCDQDFTCLTVVPLPPPMHFGTCEVVCFEDQPVFWQGIPITSSCINPPCSVRTTIAGQDCCVDSFKSFILLPPPGIGVKDTFVCDPNIPVITEDGQVHRGEVCDELIEWQRQVIHPACPADVQFCDTSYWLTIGRFAYTREFEFDCAACSGMVTICPNVEYDGNCPQFFGQVSIMLSWYDQLTGDQLGVTDGLGCIQVTKPGTYCYTVEGRYRNVTCPIFVPECVTIPEDYFPPNPPLMGDTVICAQRYGVYETVDRPDRCDFVWTVQSGGGRIVTTNSLDSARVRVDWSNKTGNEGVVCVSMISDCGTRDSCISVTFLPAPSPDAGPDQVVCAQATNFEGIEDVGGGSWTQVSGPSMANIDDPLNINSGVDVNRYGAYQFVWSETTLDCPGSDTVEILFRPDPIALGIDTICGSDANDFIVEIRLSRGEPPYTIITGSGTITNDSIFRSDVIPDNTPTTITIQDFYGCEFTYFIDHDCVCNNAPGDISMDTIKLCGPNEQACADFDPTNMVLEQPLDTFMFVLYTTVGMIQQTELARNHDGCFNFDPNTMQLDQLYYIAVVVGRKDASDYVDWNGGCVQPAEAQPVIWYTIPSPDAGPDAAICDLQIDLAGVVSVNGSSYRWLNTAGANITDASDLGTSVNVTDYGVYNFVLEEINGVCPTLDTVTITFNENPEAIDIVPECVDFVNYRYVVCFNINKGLPPYTIVSGGGTIVNGNEYCSDSLMSLVNYNIVIEDANGCSFTLPVIFNCDCGNTDVGTMDTTLLGACVDDCIDVVSNGTEFLQADEEAYFVLHEGTGPFIQNEIRRVRYDHTANPAEVVPFCFDAAAGMVTNRRYYVSRMIHAMNEPDDPCIRISPGQPLIWYDYPTSDAGQDMDFCGLEGTLSAIPSLGIGTWSLVNGPGNAIFMGGVANQMITVDAYGTYTFRWSEDNQTCLDSDEVELTFHDAPRFTNLFIECDDVAENYRIYIEVAGGDANSWDVTGVPIADVRVNTFITDWLPTGSMASWCLTDMWDCAPACRDTMFDCMCITAPGTVTSDSILCIDECVQASHNGGTLDPNDVLRYVLHDGDRNNLGANIIECNSTGDFCFDAFAMTPNTTYYITALAGNPDNGGCVDLTERCAVLTEGIPVTWYEYPVPDITQSEPEFTCEVDSMILDGIASTGPGNLNYQWTTLGGTICQSADPTNSSILICSAGRYILTVTHDVSGCATSDTIEITADEDIPAVQSGPDRLLTCDVTSVMLDGTGTDFGGDFQVTWFDENNNPIGNTLQITVTEPGTYRIFVVNSVTNCDNESTVIVDQDIDRPTADIVQIGQLTCEIDQVTLDATGSTTRGGVRSYTWSTSNGVIVGSTTGPTVGVSDPGNYQVIIVDEINGCADTTNIPVQEIGNTLAAFEITPTPPTCFGDVNGEIVVDRTIGGEPPLEYSIDGGPFSSSNIFSPLAPGDYRITVKDRNGCTMDTVINVPATPQIGIETKDDIFMEAGGDVDMDTLIRRIFGVDPMDADSIVWYDDETGERYGINPAILDSILRKHDLMVELWENGCVTRDFITIFVKFTKRVYIPNVIVPGGSSSNPENKYLTIHANKNRIQNINFLRVYDRWGELIYSEDNVPYDERTGRSTVGWDGMFNGELMNPGVYVYHFQVEFLGGAVEDYFGDVTLLLTAE